MGGVVSVRKKVIKITQHKDFADFLSKHLADAIPGKTMEEGLKIYADIYGSADKEKGVLGFWLG